MIKDGALESPKVDGIFALHLNSNFPQGTVTVKSGYCTASSAGFILKMIGKGGHISTPHRAVDPIMMAGMCIVSLQTIVSRKTDPLEPSVVGFGSVNGGKANNIIPDEVNLSGTLRTVRPEDRKKLAEQLEQVVEGVAQICGGEYALDVNMEYPAVRNYEEMVRGLKRAAEKVLNSGRIITQEQAIMGGEDVSYFFQKVPGVLWFLGTSNPDKGFIHPHHSPLFDFDENVMPLGAAIHAQSVMDFLSG
jgi:amidohydrolase